MSLKHPRWTNAVVLGLLVHAFLAVGLVLFLWLAPREKVEVPPVLSLGVSVIEEPNTDDLQPVTPPAPQEPQPEQPVEVEEPAPELPDPTSLGPQAKPLEKPPLSSTAKPMSSVVKQPTNPTTPTKNPSPSDEMALPDLSRKAPPGASLTGAVRSIMSGYDARVKAIMDRLWQPPADLDLDEDAIAVVEMVVKRDGSRLRVQIKQSSGDRRLDDKAIQLARTAPLPPLPGAYPYDEYTIKYGYRYVVE